MPDTDNTQIENCADSEIISSTQWIQSVIDEAKSRGVDFLDKEYRDVPPLNYGNNLIYRHAVN